MFCEFVWVLSSLTIVEVLELAAGWVFLAILFLNIGSIGGSS